MDAPPLTTSAALAAASSSGRTRRRGSIMAYGAAYDPWSAQRQLHRSRAQFRVMVSGRGVGKTHGAAFETLRVVLEAPPGSEGAVLAPTFGHAEAATSKLRQVAEIVPGAEWREQKKRLLLPNGRSVRVYSADRKEAVRGPSLVILWADEGAYLAQRAIDASLGALRGGDRRKAEHVQVRMLVTTTPAGKGWVWAWWEDGRKDPAGTGTERFRFRSADSPFMDPGVMARARARMGAEKAAQEFDAEFVDNLILVFGDRSELFVDSLPARKPGPRWIGVDLGKRRDWTVLVLMDEWGDARVLGRWRMGAGIADGDRFWKVTDERVVAACREHGAAAVIDTGGPGGAPGDVLAERLRAEGIQVVEVRTNQPGTKAQVVEQASADAEFGRVHVLRDEAGLWKHLDYEMGTFQGLKRVIHGREVNVYEGPQVEGEHDDCVVAFCLANWGRSRSDTPPDPLAGDFAGFGSMEATARPAPAPELDGGGWGAVDGTGYSV